MAFKQNKTKKKTFNTQTFSQNCKNKNIFVKIPILISKVVARGG